MQEAFMALAAAPFIQFLVALIVGATVAVWIVERKDR